MNAVDLGPCALPRLSAHKPVLNVTFTNSKHAVPPLHYTQWMFPRVIMAWFLWLCDSGVWWTFRIFWEILQLLGMCVWMGLGQAMPSLSFLLPADEVSQFLCHVLFTICLALPLPDLYSFSTSNESTLHCRSALQLWTKTTTSTTKQIRKKTQNCGSTFSLYKWIVSSILL